MLRLTWFTLAIFSLSTCLSMAGDSNTLGSALSSIARRAALHRGQLQRTSSVVEFPQWDLIDHLELAFVIDNTHSMGNDIDSLKSAITGFVNTLETVARDSSGGTKLRLALVTYADQASGQEIQFVTGKEFCELEEFRKQLEAVTTVTGEPFFNELVDVGINGAATQLKWTPKTDGDDKQIARWMIVCGDAPPYPEELTADEESAGIVNPGRRYSDSELKQAVLDRGIQVKAILCGAGFDVESNGDVTSEAAAELLTTYEKEKSFALSFLKSLTELHDTPFLIDLTDPNTVELLNAEAEGLRYKSLGGITEDEIANFRDQPEQVSGDGPDISVAVLPFVEVNSQLKSIDRRSPEMLSAVQLAEQLKKICGQVTTPAEVVADWEELASETDLSPPEIASFLDVECVVTGRLESGSKTSLSLQVYDDVSSRPIAQTTKSAPLDDNLMLLGRTFRKLSKNADDALEGQGDDILQSFFAKLDNRDVRQEFEEVFSKDDQAQDDMKFAFGEVATAMTYVKGASESKVHLSEAEKRFGVVRLREETNVLAHLMHASVLYNLGEVEKAQDSLEAAKQHSQNVPEDSPLRWEVAADYALLVSKDYPTAVEAYQKVIEVHPSATSESCKRAHWMLAGIHLGDWIDENRMTGEQRKQIIDPEKAKREVLTILTTWPKSKEADFYNQCLGRQRSGSEEIDIPSETQENLRFHYASVE